MNKATFTHIDSSVRVALTRSVKEDQITRCWGLLTNSTPSITHLLDSAWQLNSRAFIEDISN
jgi:hypothetical protein